MHTVEDVVVCRWVVGALACGRFSWGRLWGAFSVRRDTGWPFLNRNRARSLINVSALCCRTDRTLQEYCNARELLVVTQAVDKQADGPESGLSAVSPAEELEFPQVRKWHISRQHNCRPYWLFHFDASHVLGDLRGTLETYQSLSSRLVCKYSEDSVRALYPMIFNTPCEDQDELEGLVADVQLLGASLGDPLSGLDDQLRNDVQVISAAGKSTKNLEILL